MLAGEGKTVILITHKLREIMAVTDRVSVMRRGEMVATLDTAATSPAELADAMVGRRVLLRVEKGPARPGAVALEVENLVVRDAAGTARLDGVSLSVREGEIVGVAGVAGNGQSELLEALAGMRAHRQAAASRSEGTSSRRRSAIRMRLRRRGLLHVPEDRLRIGLVLPFEACESAMLGFHEEAALRIRACC